MQIYHITKLLPNSDLRVEDEDIIQSIVTSIKNKEDLDIRKVAENNFISMSSVSRLAKRAGFNNYKEMIFFLSQKVNTSINEKKSISDLPFSYTSNSWEEIDEIFKVINEQQSVYLSGEGFSRLMVNYAYRKLILKKIFAIDLTDMEISLVTDKKPKPMLIFSHSGENQSGLKRIEECRFYGGKVITFTATANSSFFREGDVSFLVDPESDNTNPENSTLNFFFGNCLNLLEFLFDKYL